ncbi:MAG: TolC family protein [Pseudomonadota bacterium]
MLKYSLKFSFFIFILNTFFVSAQETSSYSYESFIKDVLETNQDIEAQNIIKRIDEANILQAKAINDFTLGADANYIYYEDTDNGVSFSPTKIDGFSGGISLSHTVEQTGTIASIEYGFDKQNLDFPANSFVQTPFSINLYQPALSISIVQPLLNNLMGAQYKLPKTLARFQKDINEVQTKESIESILLSASKSYLSWALLNKQIEITKNLIGKIKNQETLVHKQVKDGMAEKEEIYRIDSLLKEKEATLESLQASYEALQIALASFLYNKEISKSLKPELPSIAKTLAENDFIKTKSRISKLCKLSVSMQEDIVKTYKNNKLPDLSLVLNYKRHGSEDAFDDASWSGFANDDFVAGLSFSFPVLNNSRKGSFLKEMYRLEKLRIENKQKLHQITQSYLSNKAKYSIYENVISKQEASINDAQLKLSLLNKKYRQGRITLFEILNEEVNMFISQMTLEKYKVDSLSIVLEMRELVDELYN